MQRSCNIWAHSKMTGANPGETLAESCLTSSFRSKLTFYALGKENKSIAKNMEWTCFEPRLDNGYSFLFVQGFQFGTLAAQHKKAVPVGTQSQAIIAFSEGKELQKISSHRSIGWIVWEELQCFTDLNNKKSSPTVPSISSRPKHPNTVLLFLCSIKLWKAPQQIFRVTMWHWLNLEVTHDNLNSSCGRDLNAGKPLVFVCVSSHKCILPSVLRSNDTFARCIKMHWTS